MPSQHLYQAASVSLLLDGLELKAQSSQAKHSHKDAKGFEQNRSRNLRHRALREDALGFLEQFQRHRFKLEINKGRLFLHSRLFVVLWLNSQVERITAFSRVLSSLLSSFNYPLINKI